MVIPNGSVLFLADIPRPPLVILILIKVQFILIYRYNHCASCMDALVYGSYSV